MIATERLRQLLDERGVKWEEPDPYQDATAWVGSSNIEYVAHEGISFDGPTGRLILFCLTPEQAVEATLGVEPDDEAMVKLHDRLNAAMLRLERDVDNGNERIAAVAEAHELLEDAATLGRGTCRNTQEDFDFMCSECGKCVDNGRVLGFNYCPKCGREIEA